MVSRLPRLVVFAAIGLALSLALPAVVTGANVASIQDDAEADPPALSSEELEQLVAPIALYPDSLLAQIFMASTYPLEVVEAERWQKANAGLKDDALAKALEAQDWDPSVKSMTGFPDVLAMMSERLDITTKIGDAFLAQQKDLMDAVQRLRVKANAEGNLETNTQQIVNVEPQTIVIEAANPQVVYVPSYNPTVVYGRWPYPAYPPYPYHPPGYVASNVVSFGVGVAVGAAWGYAWGGCNWRRGDIDINVNRNANFNRNIDRSQYRNRSGNTWNHDSSHRRGASYRNTGTADRYGGRTADRASRDRESFRGRDSNRGGARGDRQANRQRPSGSAGTRDRQRPSGSAGTRDRQRPSGSAGTRDRQRPSGSAGTRDRQRPSAGSRPSTTQRKGSAFSGSNRSKSATRSSSNRGRASRSRSSGGSRSAGRSGGGRSRGGGGRRR